MDQKNKIQEVLFKVIEEINIELPSDKQLPKSPDTVLFGKGGSLDSLGLVNLLILLEQQLDDELNVNITIADEKAMSQKRSPFATVSSLTSYIDTILKEL
tara:strand:+ start:1901 stop:2200 length:300 start_codon:yes stop_codon:yes gene_type:complete